MSDGYLLDKNGILVNKVELFELINIKNKNTKLKSLKINNFIKLKSDTNILDAINICKDFIGESIPIIDRDGKIKGIITESDLFSIYITTAKNQRELESQN